MPTTPVQISVEEYLNTAYRPDCDYIDGEVLERNMGELPHGRLQGFFGFFFRSHAEEWQIETVPETRLQVRENNYRVPDVMVLSIPYEDTLIVRTPPLLCIEILSSRDSMRETQQRVDDYTHMGVKATWVIDPWRRLAYATSADGKLHPVEDRLAVDGTHISITVAEIFAELERLEKRTAHAPPSIEALPD